MKLHAYVILLALVHPFVAAQEYTQAVRVLKEKLATYDKSLRPVKDLSQSIVVNVSFGIISVQEFDEVQERLTIGGFLSLLWIDEHIRWNESEYGGLSFIMTEPTQFWKPWIVNSNTALELSNLVTDWAPLGLFSSGMMYYAPGVSLSVMCSVDVFYYPFDTQNCKIMFLIWGYGKQVIFQPMSPKVYLNSYMETGPFKIVDSSIESFPTYLIFNIKLERKPEFLLLNIVVPIMLLALLNTLVFFIPTEAGEKISYCLTVLLSIAVFLTLVGDNLPKTSSPMSLFSFYLVAILMLSVFITLTTIASMRMYFRDNDEAAPGAFWVGLYRCLKRKQRTRLPAEVGTSVQTGSSNCESEPTCKYCLPHTHLVDCYDVYGDDNKSVSGKAQTREQATDTHDDSRHVGWKDISIMMDMVFFTVFLLLIVTLTVVLGLIIGFCK